MPSLLAHARCPYRFLLLLALPLAACDSTRYEPWTPITFTSSTGHPFAGAEPYSTTHASPVWSAVVGHLFAHALLVWLIVVLARGLRRARAEQRAQRDLDPVAPLADGPFVLQGVVEEVADGAQGPAVSVRIKQRGANHTGSKGAKHHTWTETSRAVTARPFVVKRDDGQRVRVEPDEHVDLRDDLSRTERLAMFERVRVAELVPGERVFILGELSGAGPRGRGAYRDGASTPLLRPPRTQRMMISTEKPGEAAGAVARANGTWLVAVSIGLVALLLTGTRDLVVLGLAGRVVDARPVATQRWYEYHSRKHGPGYWAARYRVRAVATLADGRSVLLEDDTSQALFNCVESLECNRVPFIVAPTWSAVHQVGTAPTLPGGWVVALFALPALAWLFATSSLAATTRWYRQKSLIDRGSGHLSG